MEPQHHYHLAGVAGSGMNPLAQALLATGARVTGSDRYFDQGEDVPVINKLQQAGVTFFKQDGSAISRNTTGLILSTAIESDNPELLAAIEHKVPRLHRSEMLAQLVRDQTCIAIAGTSGKTTTTGMVGYVLEAIGQDPTVVNGGVTVNWRSDKRIGNVRTGQGPIWVIEADESDKSLLNYTPEWAIVNTISMDHFGLDETISLFREFANRVSKGIICGPGVRKHLEGSTQAKLIDLPYRLPDLQINMPGTHNYANALATATLCMEMGGNQKEICTALSHFSGIERRLQRIGSSAPPVYDDFGHNPEKIHAAITAVSPKGGRVFACWKPHGYGPLKAMAEELISTFSSFAATTLTVFVLPVYYAGGTTSKAMESDDFVAELQQSGVTAQFATDYDALQATLLSQVSANDVVLSMGARDPALPRFAEHLAAALPTRS